MSTGYATVDQIKQANKKRGHDWFSDATVKYHGSKVETEIIAGFYFVESSYRALGEPDSGRAFRAVAANPDGAVSYLAGGDAFATVDEARAYINSVIGGR